MAQPAPASRFSGTDRPGAADLSLCVHCGFCLNVCPTYLALGQEPDSPRGRIAYMRALDSGRVDWSAAVLQHLDGCLQCRACETACPSGVPFGRMMEATRAQQFTRSGGGGVGGSGGGWASRRGLLWRVLMRGIWTRPARLRRLGRALRLYRRSGAWAIVERSGVLRRLAPWMASAHTQAPMLPPTPFEPGDVARYAPAGPARGRAALFTGCVMPILYPQTHHASARVLSRNGIRVSAPASQRCCGALHTHGGDLETARQLARHNLDVFAADPNEVVVVNAAGCGAQLREYGHLLRNDAAYAARAEQFAARVRDLSAYLVEVGFEPPRGTLERTVTYQDACHLAHAQGVRDAPRALLRSIPGLTLREMDHSDRCCGSAGLYALAQPAMSGQVLAAKMEEIGRTGADQVCTANPGCAMQLERGLQAAGRAAGLATAAPHVVEVLDESYRAADGDGYADA